MWALKRKCLDLNARYHHSLHPDGPLSPTILQPLFLGLASKNPKIILVAVGGVQKVLSSVLLTGGGVFAAVRRCVQPAREADPEAIQLVVTGEGGDSTSVTLDIGDGVDASA